MLFYLNHISATLRFNIFCKLPEQQKVAQQFAISEFSLVLVLQNNQIKTLDDMAKVQIKSEKPTPFGGIFSIMEQIDALLAQTIDFTLGLGCTLYGLSKQWFRCLVILLNDQTTRQQNNKTTRQHDYFYSLTFAVVLSSRQPFSLCFVIPRLRPGLLSLRSVLSSRQVIRIR